MKSGKGRRRGRRKGGRTPHGVRGLKYDPRVHGINLSQSHPSRGAWIEITSLRRP